MKKSLVLSGGGARGMAHVGVLKVLDELNIKVDVISGCSIGALIGAMYASGKSGTKIEEFILSTKIYKNFNLSLSPLGIKKFDKLEKKVLKFIGVRTFKKLQIPLYVNATNLSRGEEVVFSSGRLSPAIRASMAVPGIFSPVKIGGDYHIDGGIKNQLPFEILPQEIKKYILVDVSFYDKLSIKKISLVDVLRASVRLMQDEITREKLEDLDKKSYIRLIPPVSRYGILETEDKFKKIIDLGEKEARKNKAKLINL